MYCKTYFQYDWSATRRHVQSEQIYIEWCDDEVIMTRSKDSFIIMAKSILSAKLFVRKLKITTSLCLARERILQQKTVKYPIRRVECKVIHLAQGQKSLTHDNLSWVQLPNIIVLGLVNNRAFNVNISLNPYNFQHCNLNY